MRIPIRVLMIEDNAADATLAIREMQRGGFNPEVERVQTAEALAAALGRQAWDVVLSDYSLPQCSAARALAVLKDTGLDLPFIIISGTVDEEEAIDILTAGAHDFLIKGRLARLVPALQRELREANIRQEHRRTEADLRANERRFRALVENSSDRITLFDGDWRLVYRTASSARLTGYSDAERLGHHILETIHPDDVTALQPRLAGLLAEPRNPVKIEFRDQHGDGSWHWVDVVMTNLLIEPSVQAIVVNYHDITERKRAEAQIRRQLEQLAALHAVDVAITGSLDLKVTLDVFLEQVVKQLAVDAADVLLLEPQTLMLEYAAGRGFRSSSFQQTCLRVGEGRAGRAALQRRMVIETTPNQTYPPSRRTGHLGRDEFVSYCGVPLIAKGQVVGVLEVFNRTALQIAGDWLEFLEALGSQAAIAIDNATLFGGLQRSNNDLELAYNNTIAGWSRALDLRDRETEGHSLRVTEMTIRLARALSIGERDLVHLRRGALLHDIGKMAIPDAILLKPGKLTEDEWAIVRKHPRQAYELLWPIAFLRPALDIPYCHHEKWDGSGYPRGLLGEEIPLAARLFAVVDVWDALSSDRPYRPAWSPERVLEYITTVAGSRFDPRSVEIFLQVLAETRRDGRFDSVTAKNSIHPEWQPLAGPN